MAKSLSEILKGVKKSYTAKLTTGSQPGVDYAGKMKDEREFVAQHSLEKHDDRVGNGDDVYNASKTKKADMKRHGNENPKDVLAYKKAQQISEDKHSGSDDQPMYDKKKGKKLLLDKNKKEEECDHDEDEECDCDEKEYKKKDLDEAKYSAKAARAGEDIGKPGKMFKKIASFAAERYGSEESGKKVAGSILAKIRAKHMKEEEQIEEKTLTPAEIAKREEIAKAMKKNLPDMKKRYGDRAKEVLYAVATKRAKEVAEETKTSKKKMKSEQTAPADTTIQYPSTAVGDVGRV